MGLQLNEWVFTLLDRTKTTGGAPPVQADSTGSLFALTVGSSDSPTIYSDKSGTTLTETAGVAMLNFVNGHVRFFTDASVTALDISWIAEKGCGVLQNVQANSQHGLHVGGAGPFMTYIPIQGPNDDAAGAETLTGVTPGSGVICTRAFLKVMSAGAASNTVDLGPVASSTGGNADGILDGASLASTGIVVGPTGITSIFAFDGSTNQISYTPSASVLAGVRAYLEFVFNDGV